MKETVCLLVLGGLLFLLMQNNKEGLGGAAWFPYGMMKDIRQTTDGSYRNYVNPIAMSNLRKGTLEDPIFAFFDVGNRFADPREVDGLYSGIEDRTDLHKIMRDSNNKRYLDQHKALLYRSGNA